MLALISVKKRGLFTLVLLPQLFAGSNLDEDERVVYVGFVAPSMCLRLFR